MRCAVKNCGNNNKKRPCEISFFSFPLDADLQRQWKHFCCRDANMNIKRSNICMEHFKPDDFENSLEYEMGFTKRRFLKKGAVPSIKKTTAAKAALSQGRANRIKKREHKKIVETLLRDSDVPAVLNKDKKAFECEVGSRPKEPESGNLLVPIEDSAETILSLFEEYDKSSEVERLRISLKSSREENNALKAMIEKESEELKSAADKTHKQSHAQEFNLNALQTRLRKSECQMRKLEEKLLELFTKSHIAKLKPDNKRTMCIEEDIAHSKQMCKNKFPLPHTQTNVFDNKS